MLKMRTTDNHCCLALGYPEHIMLYDVRHTAKGTTRSILLQGLITKISCIPNYEGFIVHDVRAAVECGGAENREAVRVPINYHISRSAINRVSVFLLSALYALIKSCKVTYSCLSFISESLSEGDFAAPLMLCSDAAGNCAFNFAFFCNSIEAGPVNPFKNLIFSGISLLKRIDRPGFAFAASELLISTNRRIGIRARNCQPGACAV
ncbi:MAG: hypothetical protein GY757_22685, partial [bacterium]|nr:hypothetical protein [bacterium]